MAEDLDEFGIPIKKKSQPQKSADVDEFGIPIKKKIGLESAVSQSPISSTEDNTTYGTIPLEDVNISAKRVNPLVGNDLQSQITVSRQNELVQEVNKDLNKYLPEKEKGFGERLYNAAKSGVGQLGSIVSSIPSGTIDTYGRMNATNQGLLGGLGQIADYLKEIKVSDKDGKAYQYFAGVFNALPNGFKATKENLKPTMDASDFGKITEKYTGLPEEYNPLSPNNAAANYFKDVQRRNHEKAQGSYKGGIWQAIKDGKYAEAGKLTATGAVESIPLMLGLAASRGAGLSGNAALTALGVGTAENEYEQLKESNPNIDKNLLLMNAQLTGLGEAGSELLGFNMLYDQGKKLFLKGAKEEAENLIKTGLKSYLNTAFKKSFIGSATLSDAAGEMGNQLWKNAIDKWSGVDPNRDYTDGVMDAGIISLASTGGIAAGVQGLSKVINPKAKVTIAEDTQKLEQLGSEIESPTLPEEAKNALREEVANTTEKINDTIDKEAKKYDSFSEEDKVKANSLNTSIESLTASLNDENISPQAKEIIQKRIDEQQSELAKIKPVESKEKVSKSEDIFKEYDAELEHEGMRPMSDAKLEQMRDDFSKEYSVPSYEEIYDRIKKESDSGKSFFQKLTASQKGIREATEKEFKENILKALESRKQLEQTNTSNEANEQPISKVEDVEEVSTPKTEETIAKTGEESVKTPAFKTDKILSETTESKELPAEKPKFTIKGETVTPKENVSDNKQPTVEGEVKADAEVIQSAKDDGRGNEPKAERVGTADEKVKSLDRLAHQNIESEDLSNTASNQAREKGREFTEEERQYNVQKKMDALRHGDDIVVEAKNAFGDEYVSGLLKYIDDNGKTLTADKKQLMYVTLENDLNRQLLTDPDNLTLKKQEKLVADKSRAFGRETGRAVAMGQLRQLARVGYDATQVTEDFFSPKEITQRRKVEKAVQATPDDINKEYETREESRTDTEIEKAIESGVQKRIDEIYEALPSNRKQRADKAISALERIQKKLRSRTYDASIGVPIAIIDAGISTIKQAIKTGVKVADAIELGINKIKERYGKEWKNEDKFRKDMLEGFSEEKIDVEEGSSNTKTDPTVKQALIDAGYSREMTIKNKDGVKEKRKILNWKLLTGEEGSLDNINKVIDLTLGDKGYTSEEIANIKQALKDEYNDLHASIIEKATADLERRNTPRDNSSKILARRLAELYNQGLFDKDTDTYDRLINQTLGVSIKDQSMFDEIKALHKSLADLVDSRDAKGNKLSDVALSTAEAKIKNDIKKVIQKVAFSSGNGAYKATVIIKNLVNGMQRQLLNTVGQLVENPISAKYNDLQIQVQDAFKKGKWDTPELKAQRRMLSKAAYKSVLIDKGEEYGGVGSPFTTKNAFDDAIRSVTPSKLYQAYVSAVTGTAFLDSSDSAFKIKRTELEFTHNLIRVLTDKSNPNGAMSQQEALNYVSENLTGQSFADAKKTAQEIIESVNTKAGKQILSPSDTNVIRMANDIVKDSLVKGEKITKDLVEDSFKAAYTTAGTGLGHESNNIITKGLGALNRSVETELNDAIKRKEFNKAAMLNMASILTKNILNPFAGGGANWTIIGMQKMGLPVQYLDPKSYENKRLDLSSVEGLKDAQRALTARANLQRSNGRTLIAGTTGLIIAAAAYGSGSDDDIKKWRKKHPVLDKYLNKVIPPALALLTNPDQSTRGKVRAVASIIGDRSGGYGDKERLYAIGKDLATGKEKSASGRTGDLVGSRFNVPYSPIGSSQMSYQIRDLYREFMGLPPIKSNFKNKQGFTKGFFKRGWFDFLGGNDKDKKE